MIFKHFKKLFLVPSEYDFIIIINIYACQKARKASYEAATETHTHMPYLL